MSHSPEPWTAETMSVLASADHEDFPTQHFVLSQDGVIVCHRLTKSDANRIAAAVNACRGIPTEALTTDSVLKSLNEMSQKMRDGVHLNGRYAMHLAIPPAKALADFDLIARDMRSRIVQFVESDNGKSEVHVGMTFEARP